MFKIWVTIKDYMDKAYVGVAANRLCISDPTNRVSFFDYRGIRSVDWGPALTHEIEFEVTAHADDSPAFEPVAVGGFFMVVREEMGVGPKG